MRTSDKLRMAAAVPFAELAEGIENRVHIFTSCRYPITVQRAAERVMAVTDPLCAALGRVFEVIDGNRSGLIYDAEEAMDNMDTIVHGAYLEGFERGRASL